MSSLAWKSINWPLVDSRIQRYQTRIFKASKENNISKVRCIQKRLLNSFDAKLVAVRRVTTLNRGKTTPGVDKQIFTIDLQKEKLAKKLRFFPDTDTAAVVAEWLRRLTRRNQMGSSRAGSNPAACEIILTCQNKKNIVKSTLPSLVTGPYVSNPL